MATNWTDPSVTSSTHIRATHINELRSVVDKNRIAAGLDGYAWTDSPVSRLTHIRAVHFVELRTAIQDLWNQAGLGGLPNWSYGSPPVAGGTRPISARDTTDLRSWIQQYQDHVGSSDDPNYWGVDSCAAANSMVGSQTLFDYVAQQAGSAPAFWGRYIGSSCSLTAAEVSFLHGKNCKILVVYFDTTAQSVSGNYQSGVNDATGAINAAQALGVPRGVVIFADIESSWHPSTQWIQGWSDTMFDSIYAGAGGLYANTLSQFSTFDGAYCPAFSNDFKIQASVGFIWASEPEPGCTSASNAPAFAPATPPCNDGAVVAWQYAENCFAQPGGLGAVDEDLITPTLWYHLWRPPAKARLTDGLKALAGRGALRPSGAGRSTASSLPALRDRRPVARPGCSSRRDARVAALAHRAVTSQAKRRRSSDRPDTVRAASGSIPVDVAPQGSHYAKRQRPAHPAASPLALPTCPRCQVRQASSLPRCPRFFSSKVLC